MKKITLWTVLAVVIVLAGGFALGLFTSQTTQKNIKTIGLQEKPTQPDIPDSVLATGVIKPCVGAEVRVGSRVSGIVSRLHVKIGDPVTRGQLLGELDSTEFRARYNQAEAALENAQAERDYASLNVKRMRALLKKNFTSQDKVDTAAKAYDVSQSLVRQAKAALENARIQLAYTRITAPISGVVASVSTQEGETVAASFAAPTFVIIIDLDRLEVRAYVDETDIGRVKTGQNASFTVDTYSGVDFHGTVTAIYPGAEMKDNVVNYIAVIDFERKAGYTLRPEMTTTVNIFN